MRRDRNTGNFGNSPEDVSSAMARLGVLSRRVAVKEFTTSQVVSGWKQHESGADP